MLAAHNPQRDGVWRHRFLAQQEAGDLVARGVREGTLPLWTMAEHGPHLIDHWHLQEIDSQAIKTGVFKPRDTTHPLHGVLLWVKTIEAEPWADAVIAGLYPDLRAAGSPDAAPTPRRKPGPQANPGWAWAVDTATKEFAAAGMRRPLQRGEQAAIITRLLSLMSEGGHGDFSEDAGRKYALEVIARLPVN
jgi:hypothetical protein